MVTHETRQKNIPLCVKFFLWLVSSFYKTRKLQETDYSSCFYPSITVAANEIQ